MTSLGKFHSNLKHFYEKAGGKGSPFIRSLAEKVDVTPRTIEGWLKGASPDLSLAIKAADALGLSLYQMIEDDKPDFAPPRQPTKEEMACFILDKIGISGDRLRAATFILTAEDNAFHTVFNSCLRDFIRTPSNGNKVSSGGGS